MILNPVGRKQPGVAAFLKTQKVIMNKIYVGNLSYDITEKELQDLFSQQGPVTEVKVIMDRDTGKARGFAFVTMATAEDTAKAIQALNGYEMGGRALTVNEARPREESSGHRGGGGGGYGRGPRRGGGGGYGRGVVEGVAGHDAPELSICARPCTR